MKQKTGIIPVELANGSIVKIEANITSKVITEGGTYVEEEQDVSLRLFKFDEVTNVIEAISQELVKALTKAAPSKASCSFSLEIGVESGELTALVVKGSGKANLTVTLEWSKEELKS